MNSTRVGSVAEAAVLSSLLRVGHDVLTPFGGGLGYDLAYDDGDRITRVQVKSGKLSGGVIRFNTASIARSGERVGYAGRADEFGVYCAEIDRVYLVPVGLMSRNGGWLRVAATRNGQSKGILWAKDYELHHA